MWHSPLFFFFFFFIIITSVNSAENEIRYIIVTPTERGDRGELLKTFQNPEEGGNKPPNRRFMNKRIV